MYNPRSSCSNGISSPCKNNVEGEVVGSRFIKCICNLTITIEKNIKCTRDATDARMDFRKELKHK